MLTRRREHITSMHEACDHIPVRARHLHLSPAFQHQEAFAIGVRLHLPDQIEIDDGRAVDALELARIKPGDTLWFKPPPAVQVLVQSNHLFDAEYGSSENNAAIRIERVIEPVVETSNGLVTSEGGLESQAEGNSVSGVVPGGKDAKVKKTLASSKKSLGVSAA